MRRLKREDLLSIVGSPKGEITYLGSIACRERHIYEKPLLSSIKENIHCNYWQMRLK